MNMLRYFSCLVFVLFAAIAPANVVISEVDLATSRVELVNNGAVAVNITNYRWCNRVNGSPFYPRVSSATINAEFSTTPDLVLLPAEVLVFDLSPSFLPLAGGELGLYLPSGGFGSRAALVDYINWGNSRGVRDSVADDPPAIWETNAAIDLSLIREGESIQIKPGAEGDSVADYHVAPATIGQAQDPVAEITLKITAVGTLPAGSVFIEFLYNGSGSVTVTESADLSTEYTEVSERTSVLRPLENRIEFQPAPGRTFFFRLEEE
ncbi:MAG: hypothetical protein MK183_15345 [Verrucomicrobiales bacterium]|nr:hypothetical protein [Verrucomicrobiales bacterium]